MGNLVVSMAKIILLLLLALAGGCAQSKDSYEVLTFENSNSGETAIREGNDGWMYWEDMVSGKKIARFRIKGKETKWSDFDVENLWKP